MTYNFEDLEVRVTEAVAIPKAYTDFTDVDPNKLHELAELEEFIRTKGSGRAFREAVIQLFKRYILTVSSQGNANVEVSAARGIYQVLKDRLDDMDNTDFSLQETIALIDTQIKSLVVSAGDGSKPAELTDIRVGEDGITYTTAGESVRTQLGKKVSYTYGANIIDKLSATVGYYVSSTAGAKNANTSYQYNTIQSEAGIAYYMNIKANIHIAFFNSSGTYISGLLDPATFTTPTGTKYFTVSYTTSQAGAIMVSKEPIASYQPYSEGVSGSEILTNTVTSDKLAKDLQVKLDNAVAYTTGTNLIDKNNADVGFYRSYTTGFRNAQAVYQINKIEVKSTDTYYLQFASNVHISFFDVANVYISGLLDPKGAFNQPANAVWMYVSYQIAQKDAIVVSKTPVSAYVPYEYGIDGSKLNSQSITVESLSADLKDTLGASKVIKVGPGQTYTSLLKAISENTATKNTYQLVNYQVDMKQEYIDKYGADFFTNYVDYSGSDYNKRGYNLKVGDSLVGDAKSKITWNYDNSNTNVTTWFSPINLTMNNRVSNVNVEVSDGSCRYIVHDDFAWGAEGTNVIEFSKFKGRSHFSQGIGGGMMLNSTYIIDTCVFEDTGTLALTYHNNSQANAKNKLIVKNTWCSAGLGIRGTWYGQSIEMSEMIVTGCKADDIFVQEHTSDGTSPNVNLVLKAFANETL
ncbi:hypothetical protein [Streptococcus parauberis]|uniref:hypothetical protein n=1 Tax=Streptococcus parauberis TaxID=1348 RepID=UPI000E3030A4|nr:hypothetical protein [Streptococcus parauberis]RFE01066.1 hypothetical protein ADO06_01939 [Streptococcus parauberis]